MAKKTVAKSKPQIRQPSFLQSPWLLGLVLIVAVIFAYQPVWHAGFIWDDDFYVTHNPLLTAPDGLWRIWFSTDSPSQYFPLTYTVFRIEHTLWGFNSTGYHLVNILLHAVNALLVWKLLKRLAIPGAWLAAAIFALHPVQVESVAWVTECKNVLMCFFFLLTLLCWIEFVEKPSGQWKFYFAALILYALSLFSKTTACTLPAALLLILWLKHKPINWRRLFQVAPFVAMGIGMGLLTVWWERHHQGTQGKMFSMTLAERLMVASHAIWFYMGKLFWPANLVFSYPKWTIQPNNLFAYGWLAALVALAVVIYFCRRFVGRSVEAGLLFYVATLSPILGFIMLYTFRYTFVADHYQYVACIGLIALASVEITMALNKNYFLKLIICGALLLTLASLTFQQCKAYADAETLWRATLQKNPSAWMADDNLALILLQKGQSDETIQLEQKALELNPDDETADDNLGYAYFKEGRLQDAIALYKKALAANPRYAEAYNGLGHALLQSGQRDDAIALFQKALEINPDYAEALNNLGNALIEKSQLNEAIAVLQKAAGLNPDVAMIHYNLGRALLADGQVETAATQFQKAVELQPDMATACQELAWILATSPVDSLRNGNEAVELAQRTARLIGEENPVVPGTLGAAFAEAGQFPKAIAAAQRALQLADNQNRTALARFLEIQIKLYQSGRPFRDESLTNSASASQP